METSSVNPHILVIESGAYPEVSGALARSAVQVLVENDCTYDRITVPGIFEIPAAIKYAVKAMQIFDGEGRYHGFVALGCVVRGESGCYQQVCEESIRGLRELASEYSLAIGNGIVVAEDLDQATAEAAADQGNLGGQAAQTCFDMMGLKQRFGLHLR